MTHAYGLVELGLCPSCYSPDFLFVHSSIQSEPYCVPCLVRIIGWEGHTMTVGQFPYRNTIERCAGCTKPEWVGDENHRWDLRIAYLADGTEVMCHKACMHNSRCDDCDKFYAISRRRPFATMGFPAIDEELFTDMARIDGGNRCGNCAGAYYRNHGGYDNFTYCDSCEDTVQTDNTGTYRDDRYCLPCISNNVFDCSDCGTQRWDGDDHDCDEQEPQVIHSWGYKPDPIFFGEGTYHMGFELEVEAQGINRYDGATLAQDLLGEHAYIKGDASLNHGFELVTHPHTLMYYQKEFDWEVLRRLKKTGHRSWNTDTCGLHVHVSRTAFGGMISYSTSPNDILRTQAHQLRFMKLIYDNERQVSLIAGRSSSSYASFSDKGRLTAKVIHGESERGHFSAVNVENYATLEIRVFKGSLRKERVLSALEFVSACVEYTRNLKVSQNNKALSWLRFTGYVSSESDNYPNLALIMSESFNRDDDPSDDDN